MEEIDSYFDRFECFTDCHAIKDETKVKFLIASIGAKIYSKLKLLTRPKKPTELDFAAIKKLLQLEYVKTPLVHVAQHTFRQRVQKKSHFENFIMHSRSCHRNVGLQSLIVYKRS